MVAESLPVALSEQNLNGVTPGSSGHNAQNIRKRKLSGEESVGEKSLMTKNPLWLVSPKIQIPVFNGCLCSLDEVVATPFFNLNVIETAYESAYGKDFKFFDAINKSDYVAYIDSTLAGLGVFAVSIGIYVQQYCKLREIERNNDFFYFSRLFKAFNEKEIEEKMGEIDQLNNKVDDQITYVHLRAAAYFYPPDISKIACWRRRVFCSGKKREQLNALNTFLKQSKEVTLDIIRKKSMEQLCQFLNKEIGSEKFEVKECENSLVIGLNPTYAEDFFKKVKRTIDKHVDEKKKLNKKNKSLIAPILGALGQSSFIYWILMFIFYFIPIAPVVTTAAISVIPLAIALLVALPSLLIYKIHGTYHAYNISQKITSEIIEKQHKEMFEKKIVALKKQRIFLKCCQNDQAKYPTLALKDSPLLKDLQTVLKNRRFSQYHAICVGFLEGCFLPFFASWLFLDGFKVIFTYAVCPSAAMASFIPIGLVAVAIIAGLTLLVGVGYGIYSAYKAYQAHELRFNDLQDKVTVLEVEAENTLVLNKSLRDYERILRRFSDEQARWTMIKKGLSRLIILIKRLGTGSLVFRLVIWGPLLAIMAAATVATTGGIFSIILITGAAIGAFALTAWYLYVYNLESNTTQAGRIVESLVQTAQLDWVDKSVIPLEQDETASLAINEKILELKNLAENETTLAESVNDEKFIVQNPVPQENIPPIAEEHTNLDQTPIENKIQSENVPKNKSISHYVTLMFKMATVPSNPNIEGCVKQMTATYLVRN
jgi:hypothetical protein